MKATAILLPLLLCACTTTERLPWTMVGGSKADGTVIMGIYVPPKMGVRETEVQYDPSQLNAEADRHCRNWGYSGSEMYREGQFPVLITCYAQGISPCWSKELKVQYQCVDKKK